LPVDSWSGWSQFAQRQNGLTESLIGEEGSCSEERITEMAACAQTIKHRDIEPLTEPKAWKALEVHYKKIRRSHLRTLFEKDPKRGEQ